MAREIVVTKWCDRHLANDERVEAETITVGINGNTWELDLCEPCRIELVDPLAVLLTEQGAPVTGKRTKGTVAERRRGQKPASNRRDSQCLWCPLSFASESGMRTHLRTVHHFANLSHAYGSRCPMCGDVLRERGMGPHAREHAAANVPELFQIAMADGDHHGIVAARLHAIGGSGG